MKKLMRRTISLILAIAIMASLSVGVLAAEREIDAGAGLIAVATTAEAIYEASVIAQMIGRAGTSTSGAKGIAFEVIYKDLKNLKNLFKPGVTTQLAENSTDTVADLVTKKGGEIIEVIQCKDGTSSSQITDMIKRASNGQYSEAELVATKECAEAFNEKAAASGLDVRATDSGVSTDLTSKIGELYNKNLITASQAMKDAMKCAGTAAAITFAVTVAESIVKGENFSETTGNALTETGVSALSVCVGSISKAAMYNLLVMVGAPSTLCTVAPGVVAFLVISGGSYMLHIVVEEYCVKEWISEETAAFCTKVTELAEDAQEYISDTFIPVVKDTYKVAAECSEEYRAEVAWRVYALIRYGDPLLKEDRICFPHTCIYPA